MNTSTTDVKSSALLTDLSDAEASTLGGGYYGCHRRYNRSYRRHYRPSYSSYYRPYYTSYTPQPSYSYGSGSGGINQSVTVNVVYDD